MYDLGCMLLVNRDPFMVLDGLPGLYGFKYDSATACGLPLYLYSYKLVSSTTACVMVAAETWMYQDHGLLPIALWCLVD